MKNYYEKYNKYKRKYHLIKQILEFTNMNYINNKELFPFKENIDYSKLIITDEGKYSITKKDDGVLLLNFMKSILITLDDKIITDLTGNIGGDTILFGLNFKKVFSIEINEENFNALKNNVDIYSLNNVELFFGDSIIIYNWYTDVLYIDAPWGGPNYKKYYDLDLFLGENRLDIYLEEIKKRDNKPKYIFLKVPKNYRFYRLNNLGKIIKFKIKNYYIVYLSFDDL
jgi:hypothetical protein